MKNDYLDITTGISQVIERWENQLKGLPPQTITNQFNQQSRTIKQIIGLILKEHVLH